MTKANFNPLVAAAKTKPSTRQSTEVAPEPAAPKVFDTTTPARTPLTPRRFTLGDLPRYEAQLFPHLQKQFPHLNARMYGGWMRGCISDNSCLFICTDAPGGAAMANLLHYPMNPVPFVLTRFVMGAEESCIALYEHILKWAKEIGASEVRIENAKIGPILKGLKNQEGPPEEDSYVVLYPKQD